MSKLRLKNPVTILGILFFVVLLNFIRGNQGRITYTIFIGFLVVFILNNSNALRRSNLTLLLTIFGVYIFELVAVYLGTHYQDALSLFLRVTFQFACVFAGIILFHCRDTLVKFIKTMTIFIAGVCGLYGIYEAIIKFNRIAYNHCVSNGLANRYYWQFSPSNYRIATFYIHPIIYSVLVAVSIILMFGFFQHTKTNMFLMVLLMINLLLTKSRSAWIALAIVLLFWGGWYLFKIRQVNSKTLFVILICLLSLPFIVLVLSKTGVFDIIFLRFNNLSSDSSALQRTGTITYFLHQVIPSTSFGSLLIGHGLDAASVLMDSVSITMSDFSETDNQFLTTFYDQGIIVLLVVCLMILISFLMIFRTKDVQVQSIAAAFVTMSISMFFFELFRFFPTAFIYFIFLGFICEAWASQHILTRERTQNEQIS